MSAAVVGSAAARLILEAFGPSQEIALTQIRARWPVPAHHVRLLVSALIAEGVLRPVEGRPGWVRLQVER
jgi:hypothetical protein